LYYQTILEHGNPSPTDVFPAVESVKLPCMHLIQNDESSTQTIASQLRHAPLGAENEGKLDLSDAERFVPLYEVLRMDQAADSQPVEGRRHSIRNREIVDFEFRPLSKPLPDYFP
jgi:hypothetical protein